MNNRDYKNFVKGGIYHVYNRGNAKMDIFLDTQDYLYFLNLLRYDLYPTTSKLKRSKDNPYIKKQLPPNSFDLICYCLMPNHYHILIKQLTDLSITKLISKACTSYSMYFNKKYNRTGYLYQDRFKSVKIEDDKQLKTVFSYIHNNPVRSNLAASPEKYFYSSYNEYQGSKLDKICKTEFYSFLLG